MDIEYWMFGALAAFIFAGCLIDLSRRAPVLEREMQEQLKRSADTIRGAPLD